MATTSSGTNPSKSNPKCKEIERSTKVEESKEISYESLLKNKASDIVVSKIIPKLVIMLHGEPSIT